jgi:hypothetical protein
MDIHSMIRINRTERHASHTQHVDISSDSRIVHSTIYLIHSNSSLTDDETDEEDNDDDIPVDFPIPLIDFTSRTGHASNGLFDDFIPFVRNNPIILKKDLVFEITTENLECGICLETKETFSDMCKSQCNHIVCKGCMDRIIKTKPCCPMCRKTITFITNYPNQ